MSVSTSTALPAGTATKTLFHQPYNCPLAVCSAIAAYEQELGRHRETEAQLRDSVLRESDLLRQKDELIRQKDILSQESEHRLLNGLQLITSLLSLQSRATKNAEAASQLVIAANRVATLGRVHRHLHALDQMESVALKQFLEKLCHDLADLSSSSERSLLVDGTEFQIPAAAAIPLGFITSELITNSIKYANGRIVVRLDETATGSALSISDDGPGLPEDFNPAAANGLGMKLITALVRQIDGVLSIDKGEHGQGTRFTISFPTRSAPVAPPSEVIG